MLSLGSTDATGKFKMGFAEGGDYRLEFEGPLGEILGEGAKAGGHNSTTS
jgi:hypothetical protein